MMQASKWKTENTPDGEELISFDRAATNDRYRPHERDGRMRSDGNRCLLMSEYKMPGGFMAAGKPCRSNPTSVRPLVSKT